MKGIVFNLLEESVIEEHGEAAWDAILVATGVDGAYTSLGTYADREFLVLIAQVSKLAEEPEQTVIRWLGRDWAGRLFERYPEFFTPHGTARDFLLTINDVIHSEVRKLYPDAQVPHFELDGTDAQQLVMTYQSPRKLCALASGLIEGAAAHFGQTVSIRQPRCMRQGADRCVLECAFTRQD